MMTKWTLSISQESSTTRLMKVFLQNHKMSPSKKTTPVHYKREPALCLRQIARAKKWQPWVREKSERGNCDSALSVVSYRSHETLWCGPRDCCMMVYNASVFSSLQTELYNKSFCVHNLLSLRGSLFTIVIFLVKTDLGRWRFLLNDDNIN